MPGVSGHEWGEVVAAVIPGGRLVATSGFAGGLSSVMTRLDVVAPDGSPASLVARGARPGQPRGSLSIATEVELVSALAGAGLPVPRPHGVHAGPAGEVAVFDYVEGAPLVTSDDPVATGRAFATALAAVHAVDLELVEPIVVADRGVEVTRDLADPPASPAEDLRESMIREALRSLPAGWSTQRRSLLHGDFWPGNVLSSGNEIAAVIDWENAALGDPLADVATTRLDLLWAFGPEAMESFSDVYLAATGVPSEWLPAWDLAAALRPGGSAGAGALPLWSADWATYGRPDLTTEVMLERHRWFVHRAVAELQRRGSIAQM